ncbi:heme peroxidase [Saccharata proteae CBS 121410]|uniref:Peroxidase n=1 Tax=Saccharata proteae CBS 121410 TaxID=1314787 RepID=A0A6A5YFY2_9PEZI|nr:heme peroxidase [Saccharata proteae CBS 121410]
MKTSSIFSSALLYVLPATAVYTWPSAYDELEDLLYLQSGYIHHGFSDGVTPCSFSPAGSTGGRQTAAEWIRTAYHDMSTADVSKGTGGLDASILFETDRAENKGAAFNSTFDFTSNYYSIKTSMADLLALSVVVASKACKGPDIALRGGRIDATEAGPLGVPQPQEDLATHTSRFATAGFNTEDMIAMVACGHTLGGVHGTDFPEITANDSAANFEHFDTTYTTFDNKVVTEYLDDNSTNLLVIGQNDTLNSDKRVFGADGNKTMNLLADATTFQSKCADILGRMIDTVPSSVILSDIITPVEVKPTDVALSLTTNNTLSFTGRIRIRTTERSDADTLTVSLAYRDRLNTSSDAYTITTTKPNYLLGESTGFGEVFTWYEFDTELPTNTSISSFNVLIHHSDGSADEVYDNNGPGFPITDDILFQNDMSCQPQVADADGNWSLTVTAAVRSERVSDTVSFDWVYQRERQGVVIDALEVQRTSMQKVDGNERGGYVFFRGTRTLAPTQWSTTFDVVLGDGGATTKKVEYLSTSSLEQKCGDVV